ncbi:MAG: VOC family protein [Candidatus Eisenbacteria bacterium]|nr:VOC family protein [Candidatus Eisenbacteria bacterium]
MSEQGFDAGITFCATTDLEATSAFYEGLLGLRLVLDQGQCRIYRLSPSCHVGFCLKDEPADTRGIVLTFVTDEVDAWYERLTEAGVSVEKEPQSNEEYRIYHLFARDPNGYLVEIQRFDDPRWSTEG